MRATTTPAKIYDTQAIDAALARGIAAVGVPGLVAVAADANGTIYEGAFGFRTLGGSEPMTLDTTFHIHSMTKAITGVAVMQLVEEGRIGLEDEVGRFVAGLASPRVLAGVDAAGVPVLRPARRPIRLRHLLTHSSGLAYETWNEDFLRYMRHSGLSRLDMFADPDKTMPLAFDPGDGWAYGFGMEWAGRVVEAVTGRTLEETFQARIFEPLGMTSTGYRLTPGIAARLAGCHQRKPNGELVVAPFSPMQDPKSFMGGGGLISTASDYARFMRMILNRGSLDGVRVLREDTVATMARNHLGDIDAGAMRSVLPDQSQSGEFYPGISKRWGLSFLINMADVPGARRAGSLTWAGLRNTYFWIDPTAGIAGTVMTQILPFLDSAALASYETFEREVYRMTSG